jgi:Tfp pilus assembly protein PilP
MASPVQGSPRRERVLAALQSEDFAYAPENLIDPFLSFIVTQTENLSALTAAENDEEPPKLQMPLTPLQKMALGQIERGFKGVLWGEMGIRAMVEDDAGKGYIVAVGTPIGSHNGVVSDILSDRMVIRQEVWDPGQKKLLPRTVEIKLQKSAQR